MLVELSPIAFKLALYLHWYGVFMALSFLVGSYYLYNMGLKGRS